MEELSVWIKFALVGSSSIVDTLQGRITSESFGSFQEVEDLRNRLQKAIEAGVSFKVFDPIKLQITREGIGAAVLVGPRSMPIPTTTDYLILNSSAIAWWAPFEETEDWARIVAGAVHGIEIGGDMPPNPQPESGRGPRLLKP